jgi:glycosyltransferase involved in cell wall biosynthesis
MKICRVFPNFQTDLLYAEHYLAKEFSKMGHHTTFITSDRYLKIWEPFIKSKEGNGNFKHDYFDVERYSVWFPLEKVIWKNWFTLYKRLFKSDFEVIHLLTVGSFSTVIVLLLSYFAPGNSPRIIISDHSDKRAHSRSGFFAKLYYTFFRVWFRLFGSRVEYIIAPLPEIKDLLSKRFGINPKRIELIEVGFDSDVFNFKPELKNTDSKMLIGFAGKLAPSKEVDKLLRGIHKANIQEFVKVHIAGRTEANIDYCRVLEKLGEELDIEIEWSPFMKNNELCEFYNFVDLAVFPGGVSITTIEASGCGIPVVIFESLNDLNSRVSHRRGDLFKTEEELAFLLKKYFNLYKQGQIDCQYIAEKTKELVSWHGIVKQYFNLYTTKWKK